MQFASIAFFSWLWRKSQLLFWSCSFTEVTIKIRMKEIPEDQIKHHPCNDIRGTYSKRWLRWWPWLKKIFLGFILIGGIIGLGCVGHMGAETTASNIKQHHHEKTEQERLAQEAEMSKSFFSLRPAKVNPFLQNYVVKPSAICDEDTYIVILIHTYHVHADRRWAIRNTWGSVSKGGQWPHYETHDSIRLVFILGLHQDDFLNAQIQEEAETHNDIVQGDFTESLNNSTRKSLLGMHFFIQYCPYASFYMKTEDDVFVHVPNLLNRLHHTHMNRTIMGQIIHHEAVHRNGKNNMTTEDYPFKYYTPHENRAGYIIDGSLVRELFHASEYVPLIHLENLYVTGILGRIFNVTHVSEESPFLQVLPGRPCLIVRKMTVVVHRIRIVNILKVWDELLHAKSCLKNSV